MKPFPLIIYKYQKVDEYFFQHLIKNEFWFSRPEEFNDPYDCNIGFRQKGPDEEREIVKKYFILEERAYTAEQLTKLARSRMFSKKEVIKENTFIKSIRGKVQDTGVCCFSAIPDNLLMWSHYANSHKGVCLGYRTEVLVSTFNIHWVKYGTKFPRINYIKDKDGVIPTIMTHKSIDWKYEKEIRMIGPPGLRSFKRQAIQEVIFGLRTPNSQIIAIMGLLFQSGYENVNIRQVTISDGEYRVKFKRISSESVTTGASDGVNMGGSNRALDNDR